MYVYLMTNSSQAPHRRKPFGTKSTVSKFLIWAFVVSIDLAHCETPSPAAAAAAASRRGRWEVLWNPTQPWTHTLASAFVCVRVVQPTPSQLALGKKKAWHHADGAGSSHGGFRLVWPTSLSPSYPHLPSCPHKHTHWRHLVPAVATTYKLSVCPDGFWWPVHIHAALF